MDRQHIPEAVLIATQRALLKGGVGKVQASIPFAVPVTRPEPGCKFETCGPPFPQSIRCAEYVRACLSVSYCSRLHPHLRGQPAGAQSALWCPMRFLARARTREIESAEQVSASRLPVRRSDQEGKQGIPKRGEKSRCPGRTEAAAARRGSTDEIGTGGEWGEHWGRNRANRGRAHDEQPGRTSRVMR